MSPQPAPSVRMDATQARRLVIGAAVLTALLASAEAVADGGLPPVRIVIGALVVAAILSALTEASPSLAGGFALLILFSAIFTSAPRTWGRLTEAISK